MQLSEFPIPPNPYFVNTYCCYIKGAYKYIYILPAWSLTNHQIIINMFPNSAKDKGQAESLLLVVEGNTP